MPPPDPAAAADAAWAAADTLHAAAAALGSRMLRQAADAYDRAARAPYGRIPRPTPAGHSLRRAARLLSAAAFASHDRNLAQIALITRLAALADAVAELRKPSSTLPRPLPPAGLQNDCTAWQVGRPGGPFGSARSPR